MKKTDSDDDKLKPKKTKIINTKQTIKTDSDDDKLKPKKTKNKGEKGEINVLKILYNLSNSDNNIEKLISLFGNDACEGITFLNIETLQKMTNINEIKKTSSLYKADCALKFNKTQQLIYISIKCVHGAMPAILNHTPRSAKVFQESGSLYSELHDLDKIIKKMNIEREIGNTGEDIQISKLNFSEKEKKCICNVLQYFIFDGTGSKKSQRPANSILEISDPSDIKKWTFFRCDDDIKKLTYTQLLYNRVILSLRNKGMTNNKLNEPWIFKENKNNSIVEKGSLHARITKIK